MTDDTVMGPGKVIGALLAGGKSRRMGRDKAGAPWVGGRRLADAALSALEAVCDGVVVLGHGNGLEHRPELMRVPDLQPDIGPLAGLEALLASGLADRYLICPCDMPFVSVSLLEALLREGGPATIVRRADDRTEPFPLALDANVALALRAYLVQGGRSVRGFLDTIAKTTVSAISDPDRALLNINTPGDLEGAMCRAAESQAPVRTGWDLDAADPAMIDFAVSKWQGGKLAPRAAAVPAEAPLLLRVEGHSSHLIMRTPGNDEALVLGRLLAEGVIGQLSDLAELRREPAAEVDQADQVWVRLQPQTGDPGGGEPDPPEDGAASAAARIEKDLAGASLLTDDLRMAPAALDRLPTRMRQAKGLFGSKRGMHSAALFGAGGQLLMVREDVGRHNAIDKVLGNALQRQLLPLQGHILLVSGRISYAMASKALAAGIPVLATLSTPTSMAVRLAEANDLTLVAFLRGGRFNTYGASVRVGL